jgi:ubiquinol-cytochrome c reductase cytochrome c1 subunit
MTTVSFAKKVVLAMTLVLGLVGAASANTGGPAWDKAPNRINDMTALQNGAKLFTSYCLNCHSAAFMRYTRLTDLGFTQDQIKASLLVTNSKIGDTMKAAIDPQQAKAWFGNAPPDLSVIVRSRAGDQGSGADYLYTYMRSFYRDETTPTGWNNRLFPNVAMPHVLWELQGVQAAKFKEATVHGQVVHEFEGFEPVTPGKMSPADYDNAVGDLVNYMQWMGEPAQTTRQRVGIWVLIFLAGLSFLTWKLNKAYWKDIK